MKIPLNLRINKESHKKLAYEVTALVHGRGEAEKARKASEAIFKEEIKDLPRETFEEVFADLPALTISADKLNAGLPLVEILCLASAAKSKAEATRLIEQGGIYLNNVRQQANFKVSKDNLILGEFLLLRKGKKDMFLLKILS